MSADIIDDEWVVTRAPIKNDKPSFKPATDTLDSSSSTPITASTSTISPSAFWFNAI